jgi:hypothetical protein
MTVSEYIEKFEDWQQTVVDSLSKDRKWCTLDVEKLDKESVDTAFNTDEQEEAYLKGIENGEKQEPYAFLQLDSDVIFSFHKCFTMRHKTRLQNYRDDLSNKDTRVKMALRLGKAKYDLVQSIARERGNTE